MSSEPPKPRPQRAAVAVSSLLERLHRVCVCVTPCLWGFRGRPALRWSECLLFSQWWWSGHHASASGYQAELSPAQRSSEGGGHTPDRGTRALALDREPSPLTGAAGDSRRALATDHSFLLHFVCLPNGSGCPHDHSHGCSRTCTRGMW